MVRCIDCGFFAGQWYDNPELLEVPLWWRKEGSGFAADRLPRCFEDVLDLVALEREEDERDKVPRQVGYPVYPLRTVLQREIECASFVGYKQGFTPKEHRSRLDQKELLDREDRRDNDAALRHKQQMAAINAQHWRELIVFGGVIAVATIVAAILEGAISRGWEPGWWPW